MMDTRFKKTFADLWTRKGRTLITVAGLVLGLGAVFTVAIAFRILTNDLSANFTGTNPPSIVVNLTDQSEVDLSLVEPIPGVRAVEDRPMVLVRYAMGPDKFMPAYLFVVDDFDALKVATFAPQSGTYPPQTGSIVLERDSELFFKFMKLVDANREGRHGAPLAPDERARILAEIQTTASMRLADGRSVSLPIVGTVHDPGLAPTRMEQVMYGYISRETTQSWGDDIFKTRLVISLDPEFFAESETRRIAQNIEQQLGEAGFDIRLTEFPSPTLHPHQFQLNSILFLLASLGVLGLASCVILVVNLMNAILTTQIRQIGVLKAIGASVRQTTSLFLASMVLLGSLASGLALWQADAYGRSLTKIVAAMLNFNILTQSLPLWFYGGLFLTGIAFPVVVAGLSVRRWAGLPVRAALDSNGVSDADGGGAMLARLLSPLPLFVSLGIRNAFRRPLRTGLTMATLGVGLMVFVVMMNVRSSLLYTAEVVDASMQHELVVALRQDVKAKDVAWINQFKTVERSEVWSRMRATVDLKSGDASEEFVLSAVPGGSQALAPNMISGSWVTTGEIRDVVVNQRFIDNIGDYKLGDTLEVAARDQTLDLRIIGVIKEFGSAGLYVNEGYYRSLFGGEGTGNTILVTLKEPTPAAQSKVKGLLEQHFEMMNVQVIDISSTVTIIAVVENHLDVIGYMLGVVAVMMLVVSGLGMASAVSAATVERTRELGILRAVGGTGVPITTILVAEALFVVVVAWVLVALGAPAASGVLTAWFGDVIVEYPFDYRSADWGLAAALAVGCIMAILATALPVRIALARKVRDALGYE